MMSNEKLHNNQIGLRIRTARKEKGINQTELANLLGKSLRTIQKYESGEIEVSIAMLNEIAKVLGVPNEVINKKPSAGLWKGQSDEDELGVSYDDIEKYFEGEAIAKEKEERIKKLYNSTEHKRSDIDYFKNIY